jgi:hypothetical protein
VKLVVKLDWCFGRQDFVTSLRPQRDGRGLAFVDGDTEANVWVQPLDGQPPHQLTHFNDGRTIVSFAWSRDGTRLAVARATVTNDIVLFKGLKC